MNLETIIIPTPEGSVFAYRIERDEPGPPFAGFVLASEMSEFWADSEAGIPPGQIVSRLAKSQSQKQKNEITEAEKRAKKNAV